MGEKNNDLSRRERQIMDFLYQAGRASAAEVLEALPDPPGYSAVRATLRILEQKGHVRHEEDGRAYVFIPVLKKDAARKRALTHLLKTFFDNSTEQAVAALVDLAGPKASAAELDRIRRIIDDARREGR
jgi:BlaI family transcriptional regulator, penicillinase repressor